METLELVLFLAVAGIAILAAVMMLLSENAVHSALFLVLNFACVGFLYLMLNAAFLAMVQVAVYAGAIMVLFMFVIMLLGAERVAPETRPRFPWLTRTAVGLTTLFLLVAGVALLQADIEGSEPHAPPALVRVVNAAPSLGHINVRLGDSALADDLAPYESSDFEEVTEGEFELHLTPEDRDGEELTTHVVVAANSDDDDTLVAATVQRLAGVPAAPTTLEVFDPSLEFAGGEVVTLVLTPLSDGSYGFIPVMEDLSSFGNDRFARVQVVHAMADFGAVDVADVTVPSNEPYVQVRDLNFGEVSDEVEIKPNNYRYGLYGAGVIDATLAAAGEEEEVTSADVETIDHLEEAEYKRDTSSLLVIAPPPNDSANLDQPVIIEDQVANLPAFGSPTSVGHQLFTRYMLPFQAIALLLLVAMIGAIVMTRDALPAPKPRHPRRLANVAGNPVVED